MAKILEPRIRFKHVAKHFPQKLFEVVNDDILIHWTDHGNAIVAEERHFEEQVMQMYPGFVQVGTFHNLRRLLRDYGFFYQILRKRSSFGLKIQFHHPEFSVHSTTEILRRMYKNKKARSTDLRSRYKSTLKSKNEDSSVSSSKQSEFCLRKAREQSNDDRFMYFKFKNSTIILDTSVDGDRSTQQYSTTSSVDEERMPFAPMSRHRRIFTRRKLSYLPIDHRQQSILGESRRVDSRSVFLQHQDTWRLLQLLAENELSEPEQLELLLKHCDNVGLGRRTWQETMDSVTTIIESLGRREPFPLFVVPNYRQLTFAEL